MANYSIKDLETLSGIKAHTLRIWEQRYGILTPKRSDTNIRYYNDDDLKLLLNITFLNNNGYKISQISRMSSDEINEHVLEMTESKTEFGQQLESLVMSMVRFDEHGFEKIISTSLLRYGLEKTMIKIVYPFLNKVGILWQTGKIKPAHEHFITHLIRQKLIVAIDGQVLTKEADAKKFILFLPEGEFHDMPLLFSYYLLKLTENKVVYLGPNVPLSDLNEVAAVFKPDYLLTVFTAMSTDNILTKFLKNLSQIQPDAKILITGDQVIKKEITTLPENVIPITSISKLQEFVRLNTTQQSSTETVD